MRWKVVSWFPRGICTVLLMMVGMHTTLRYDSI
jgi:hypothetical protein